MSTQEPAIISAGENLVHVPLVSGGGCRCKVGHSRPLGLDLRLGSGNRIYLGETPLRGMFGTA